MRSNTACAEALGLAVDPQGQTWSFNNLCFPEGWTPYAGDKAPLRITCERDAGPPDSGSLVDASRTLDSGTVLNEAGIECCIPSPMPDCSMSFGGAKTEGVCPYASDGMRVPGPWWRLGHDRFGCPAWTSQGANVPCCGYAPTPADAGSDYRYMCYPDLTAVVD